MRKIENTAISVANLLRSTMTEQMVSNEIFKKTQAYLAKDCGNVKGQVFLKDGGWSQ